MRSWHRGARLIRTVRRTQWIKTFVIRLRRTLPLIPCLACGCVVACSRPPYPQRISGVLLKSGQAAAAVRVRFISTQSAGACTTGGLDGVTDPDGRFRLDQMYNPSTIERLVVLVHSYELCVAVGGAWKPLWQETTGPAPRSI